MSRNKDRAIQIILTQQKEKVANPLELATCYLLVEVCDLLEDIRRHNLLLLSKITAYSSR